MDGFISLSIQPNNVCFKHIAFSLEKPISEIDKKVNDLIKNRGSLDGSVKRLVLSKNQLKRKVDLRHQKCLREIVKAVPVHAGPYVVDQAKRIGTAAFYKGSSICLGILTGCVLRVFVEAMYHYYFHGNLHFFSPSYTKFEMYGILNYKRSFKLIIIGPLIEEILFRKILQRGVSRITKSPLAGIVVSAGLFGAAHLDYPTITKVPHYIVMAFFGVPLGILNHQLGLAASVGAHAAYSFGYVCEMAYRSRHWW